MKKIFYILAFFITSFSFAQGGPKVDVIKFRGEVTTTIRDTFDVPAGETWLIWNVTTSQLEIAGSDDVWSAVFDSSGFVTLSGIQTLTGQKTFSINPKIETYISLLEDGGSGSVSGYGSLWVGSGNVLGFTPANESFKARFDFPDLTADRTITFPDADVDLSTGLTDNQTLAEVLTEGADANDEDITNVGSMGFSDIDSDGNEWLQIEQLSGSYQGDMAFRYNSINRGFISNDGFITDALHLTTKDYVDTEISAASGTDSGQIKTLSTGSSKTFALSDFVDSGSLTGREQVHSYTSNDTITLPTGLGQTGRIVRTQLSLDGADSVYIKKGASATIYIPDSTAAITASDGFILKGGRKSAIIELWPDDSYKFYSDEYVFHTEVACTFTAGNLFPSGNAASECTDEADSTSGWTSVNATISSVEGDTQEGTSAIQIQAIGQNYSEGDYTVTGLTDNATYDVTYWYKVTLDDGAISSGVRTWGGVDTSPNSLFNEDGAWHENTHTITMNGTSLQMEFFANRVNTTGTQTILIDHIRVVPQ